ncbi:FMN-dependent NADH-azoreductase [Burkholderia sp. MSMB1835]|uniref:FMN-dependent NADH-azoreductase n=1 Tax=Burkholderia sp. MSMB1835 TaxID=1637876 RepID=UPI00075CFBA2|nr:FMN-dependent NADH-azoreductase [Burkholderia sp. MSMB1835]KVL37377.1 FMN-dependent NADH-azoreductase [Burkholderia sp. MSMB1835]
MATKLLHLDSSILGAQSVSRSLSAAVVDQLRSVEPSLEVTYRDLAEAPLPHLTGAYFAAMRAPEAPVAPALQGELAEGTKVLEEFLAADVIVIGLGLYNFGVPSQLKAWIDRIAVAGKTFRYTENGPVGLVGDKRVIVTIARGGFYGEDSPARALEHAETYLRGLFAFVGIHNLQVISADGISVGPDPRQEAIVRAQSQIAELVI